MEYCFIHELTHWIQIQLQADVESLKQERLKTNAGAIAGMNVKQWLRPKGFNLRCFILENILMR